MKFAKMSTMATFILRQLQYREVVGVAIALQRGNALMDQVQRAVGDIGNDVSRFISLSDDLSDASDVDGGHLRGPISSALGRWPLWSPAPHEP